MWFDPALVEAVRDAFPEWTAFLFAALSYLGSVWFVAPVVVLCYWFGDRRRFATWLAVVLGGYAVMVGSKGRFSVERPGIGPAIAPGELPPVVELAYAPAVEVSSSSFPSGHAIAGTVVWTMLALESDVGSRGQRLAGAAAMIGLVAFSRVAVGLHYPVDVTAGVAVGVAYLAAILFVLNRVENTRRATVAFGLAAGIGFVALIVGGRPDAAALGGAALGGLIAWRYAPPPRRPWPRTPRGLVPAVAGCLVLAAVAGVLALTDAYLAWATVGLLSGALVVALPSMIAVDAVTRTDTETPA